MVNIQDDAGSTIASNVVAQWFTKEHAEEGLGRVLSDAEWEQVVDWFDTSSFPSAVSDIFFDLLTDAVEL